MSVVDVLNHRFSRMQHMGVRHMVEKEQQLIRAGRKVLIFRKSRVGILPRIGGPRLHGPVPSDSVSVGIVVCPPPVVLIAIDIDTVVDGGFTHEANAKRTGISLVHVPRCRQNRRQLTALFFGQAKALADPFFGNRLR